MKKSVPNNINEESSNINELCRLCLRKDDKIDIFNNNEKLSLSLRIIRVADVEIQPNDSLPKRLCCDCRYQLEKSYFFRKKCKTSDAKLRRHLKLINAGKTSKITDMSDDEDEEEYAQSMEFFAAKEEERIKRIAKEKEDREREFEDRLKIYMDNERKKFHEEETNRIIMQQKLSEEENHDTSQKKVKAKTKINKKKTIKVSEEKILGPKILNKFIINNVEKNVDLINQDETQTSEQFDIQEENNEAEEEIENVEEEEIDENKDDDDDLQEDNNTAKKCLINTENTKSSDFDDMTISDTNEPDSYTINTKDLDSVKRENEFVVCENLDEVFSELSQTEFLQTDNKIDDCDIVAITKAVKTTLINQIGLGITKDMQLKMERRADNIARVEVTTGDGSTILMEIQMDNISKDENGESKVFRCTQCPKSFTRRPHLLRHSSVHIKNKGFSCKYCEKWFPSKSSMERHERVHTGERPFQCDVCDRSFIQKEILKRHQMIHTGLKPFPCKLCDKKFTQSDMLRQHVNRKHSENPVVDVHKCNLCPKTFCYSSGLSRHLLVHSGKVFNCSICGKSFNDRSAVKRHERSHQL